MPDLISRIPAGPRSPLTLPKEFARLYDLAYNMWWTWDAIAYELISRIDPRRWVTTKNALSILQVVEPEAWEALSASPGFVDRYTEAVDRFDAYMKGDDTWFQRNHEGDLENPVAYLCTEFGLHATLPLYSGGLGVLAGDHLKAASDLGLPLVAVGLLYRRGYFRQEVDPDGHQQHIYNQVELARRPLREVEDPKTGRALRIEIELPDRTIYAGAWRLNVGRVPLLLLDTNVQENAPADRPITQILYVRGREMRLHQEIVLGIGAVRLLEALDIEPSVWHVNEGHAALSLLERLSKTLAINGGVERAKARVADKTLFTLHTPVPAGNEVFDLDLVTRTLTGTLPGITDDMLRELSQARPEPTGHFDLGALAIELSSITNGVSKRHGEVVTSEWGQKIGGEALAVTNGVHSQTWIGNNMARLYEQALGRDWVDRLLEAEAWKAVHDLPDEDVWNAHVNQKERMLRMLRANKRAQLARHGKGPTSLHRIDEQLPTDWLTIVFARRFATYKRPALLFSDPGRMRALLTNPERPVQLIFAGKAHPADREGQGLIRWVVEMSNAPDLSDHIFFVEGYDMDLAKSLVTGADVWLNNPRPPMEASGTSGMKAAANGALNLSVLDGWWVEGFEQDNGWGFSEHFTSDAEDAGTLYHLLEAEVIPRYYDRDDDGLPVEWIRMMKASIASATPNFSMQRTVVDYLEKAYLPLGKG